MWANSNGGLAEEKNNLKRSNGRLIGKGNFCKSAKGIWMVIIIKNNWRSCLQYIFLKTGKEMERIRIYNIQITQKDFKNIVNGLWTLSFISVLSLNKPRKNYSIGSKSVNRYNSRVFFASLIPFFVTRPEWMISSNLFRIYVRLKCNK